LAQYVDGMEAEIKAEVEARYAVLKQKQKAKTRVEMAQAEDDIEGLLFVKVN